MCRIFGYSGNKDIPLETFKKVAYAQLSGGPDYQNFKRQEGWGLGNNRLAIQGLDGGLQPFISEGICAVYNGEIYNHQELKQQLRSDGFTIEDSCDGSVIIPLYQKYGDHFVEYLDGMFAIALIDTRQERKLLLASDPCAIKSLYYYWDQISDTFYFSSELPALFQFPIPRELKPEAIDEYLIGRSIWHHKTVFKDIDTLGPSALLIKKEKEAPILKQYQSKMVSNFSKEMSFQEATQSFDQLFDQEIKQMTMADAPICAVTSGGLDSSYVTAVASKYIPNLTCFNIAYEGNWPSDEKHFAKEVADYYGVNYHQVTISEKEFPYILEKTIAHLGQPNSAPHSLSTYALFKAIHQEGFKVAITGEGADEFFGGYERFRKATFNQEPNWFSTYFDTMCATTQSMRDNAYSSEYQNFLASGNHHLLAEASQHILHEEEKNHSRLKALLAFDQNERFPSYILRRVDHLSMASSVEVRVPFCQPKVAHFSRNLPDDYLLDQQGVKKIIYAAGKYKLPSSILNRPKQPFTLPIVAMLKKGFVLFDIMHETLNSQAFINRGLFNQAAVNALIQRQQQEDSSATADMLWSMTILELWLQQTESTIRL